MGGTYFELQTEVWVRSLWVKLSSVIALPRSVKHRKGALGGKSRISLCFAFWGLFQKERGLKHILANIRNNLSF